MHFEVLVEDQSGSIALDEILEKILGANDTDHSWKLIPYKGLGRIPKGLRGTSDPQQRILLDRLPQLLRGYGKSLQDSSAVIVVVDLDRRNCMTFKQKLRDVLAACDPRPRTLFRIAIEESEAWLLGDCNAVKAAYPRARDSVLNGYKQDSICGTWEVLADAVNRGGSAPLKRAGYPEAGQAKCEWARNIAPHLDVNGNQSKSFQVFRDGIRKLAGIE
jgi:hypothetical protein